ncbi:NADAR family protein [Cochlodiniinecator piscidefendens]|uniref:NADAR family protein n=1 Tax=Cochlodiniinecator piscidefendens TaxID=2715756 RepID=UPI001409CEDA|nr:NADAR family protein [Cochlodiniinecator piscidefendens]
MLVDEHSFHFFWSGPFSQWHPSHFSYADQTFETAEQAMMYEKAILFNDAEIGAQILAEPEPGCQKALGRKVRGFDHAKWDAEKVKIVTNINMAKFDQNKGLRRKLFQTLPKQLAEASPVDTIWGIGLDAAHAVTTPVDLWPGQNLLGQILTSVRDELAKTYPKEARACASETWENIDV